MTKITRLRGYAAIKAAEREPEVKLCKYEDPMEPAREGLTVAQARQIAREDDGLIFADIVEDVAKPVAEQSERAKHTPGPWRKLFLNGNWHIARTDGRVEIAKVASYKSREVSTANARLIAAAPELAEMLGRMTDIFGDFTRLEAAARWVTQSDTAILSQARALLAKINS